MATNRERLIHKEQFADAQQTLYAKHAALETEYGSSDIAAALWGLTAAVAEVGQALVVEVAGVADAIRDAGGVS